MYATIGAEAEARDQRGQKEIREIRTRDQGQISICILDLISPPHLSLYNVNTQKGWGGRRGMLWVNIIWTHSGLADAMFERTLTVPKSLSHILEF